MAQIFVYDRSGAQISVLASGDTILDMKRVEKINGERSLELETTEKLEKGYTLAYKDTYGVWHEYVVTEEDEEHSDANTALYYCESSYYELAGKVVKDKRPHNTSASVALAGALEGTRWSVGNVDNLGTSSANFYYISALEALEATAEAWGAEIVPRVVVSGEGVASRYIDLKAQQGDSRGKRFEYGKDLIHVKRSVSGDPVFTRLYGRGKGEQVGAAATAVYGIPMPNGSRAPLETVITFDDIEDPTELLQATQAELEKLSKPKVTYEAKVIDLAAAGFEHEGVGLGDEVQVIDRAFIVPLELEARVIAIEHHDLAPEETVITLGNFVDTIIDTLRSRSKVWDRAGAFTREGTLSASWIDGMVAALNDAANATGGYTYIEEGDGLITYDKPRDENPTKAIQLIGGTMRIASSKLPDGSWNWRTFGTGSGFTADVINAGHLRGGAVDFDLENGSLVINTQVGNVKIILDGQQGFSIYDGSEFIGGLVVGLDGSSHLVSSRMSNRAQSDSFAEVGIVTVAGAHQRGLTLNGSWEAGGSTFSGVYMSVTPDINGDFRISDRLGRLRYFTNDNASAVVSPHSYSSGVTAAADETAIVFSTGTTTHSYVNAARNYASLSFKGGAEAGVNATEFYANSPNKQSYISVKDDRVVIKDSFGTYSVNDWIKDLDQRISALGG